MATAKKAVPQTVGIRYVGDLASVTVMVYFVDRGLEDLTFPHGETVQVPRFIASRFEDDPNFEVA